MKELESLPNRPLRRHDLDGLQGADRIDSTFARFWTGSADVQGDYTAQFDLFLDDDRVFAIHYDPESRAWRAVDELAADEYDNYADAIEQLEISLEEARGDDQAYGQRFAEACGLL